MVAAGLLVAALLPVLGGGWSGAVPRDALDLHLHDHHDDHRTDRHPDHVHSGESHPLIYHSHGHSAEGPVPVPQGLRGTRGRGETSVGNGRASAPNPAPVRVYDGPMLQDALDRAAPGSLIELAAGRYEGLFHVSQPITVVGEPGAVLTGGSNRGDVLLIEADGVYIKGVAIEAPGARVHHDDAAIKIRGSGNWVEASAIVSAGHGIYIEGGAGNRLVGNIIRGHPDRAQDDLGNGIHLFDTSANEVIGNHIEGVRDGIYFSFASGNIISENVITRSRYGLHEMYTEGNQFVANTIVGNVGGAALMFSRESLIEGNLVAYHLSHRGYGVLFKDSSGNVIRRNRFANNRTALFLDMSHRNEIGQNDIHDNGIGIHIQASAADNRIVVNNFAANLSDARLEPGRHTSRWDDGQNRGNYWANYRGADLDGEGRGGLPHRAGSAYAQWAGGNALLWAFQYSPAARALDWLEALIPAMQVPKAVDSFPLMVPVTTGSPRSLDGVGRDRLLQGARQPIPGDLSSSSLDLH